MSEHPFCELRGNFLRLEVPCGLHAAVARTSSRFCGRVGQHFATIRDCVTYRSRTPIISEGRKCPRVPRASTKTGSTFITRPAYWVNEAEERSSVA
jgi:hypothetical protein